MAAIRSGSGRPRPRNRQTSSRITSRIASANRVMNSPTRPWVSPSTVYAAGLSSSTLTSTSSAATAASYASRSTSAGHSAWSGSISSGNRKPSQ